MVVSMLEGARGASSSFQALATSRTGAGCLAVNRPAAAAGAEPRAVRTRGGDGARHQARAIQMDAIADGSIFGGDSSRRRGCAGYGFEPGTAITCWMRASSGRNRMVDPMDVPIDETTGLPFTIPGYIRWWLSEHRVTGTRLAERMGIDRRFLHEIMIGRRELPDDRIGDLPDGLREMAAEIRARRYEGAAWLVRQYARQPA